MYEIKEYIEREIAQCKFLKNEIDQMKYPVLTGTMICKYRNNKLKYYKQITHKNKKRAQIPINEKEVSIRKYKKYNECLSKVLSSNINLLESIYPKIDSYSTENIMEKLPNTYRYNTEKYYINPQNTSDNTVLSEQNNSYKLPECPNIAIDGTPVYSKGEIIIYNLLKFYKIPFYFNKGIKLKAQDGSTIIKYVDFIIEFPSKKLFFWEHAGMLEKENYSDKFISKIILYQRNNIILGENFIITSDRQNGTINAEALDRIIRQLILPHFA